MTKSEKVLVGLTVGLLVLVASVTWWWTDINAMPAPPQVPPRELPSPNAWDYFVRAGSMVDGEEAWDACISIYNKNYYRQVSPSAREAVCKKYLPAIEELRKGFAYSYREPEAIGLWGKTQDMHAEQLKGMSILLALSAAVNARNENWASATRFALDGIEMGAMCPNGSPLRMKEIGIRVQDMILSKSGLWQIIPHLTASEARAATHRMEAILAKRTTWAETIKEEKWTTLACLYDDLNDPEWRPSLELAVNILNPKFRSGDYIRDLCARKRDAYHHIAAGVDALIRDAEKPYALRSPLVIPPDSTSECILPMLEEFRLTDVANETQDNLLLVVFALQAYHEEHGAYPVSLAELTPKYLKAIPDDPFAKRGQLKYVRTGKTYTLYSVGPDAKDDGGKPCKDGYVLKGNRYIPDGVFQESSTGDIVAGVNLT